MYIALWNAVNCSHGTVHNIDHKQRISIGTYRLFPIFMNWWVYKLDDLTFSLPLQRHFVRSCMLWVRLKPLQGCWPTRMRVRRWCRWHCGHLLHYWTQVQPVPRPILTQCAYWFIYAWVHQLHLILFRIYSHHLASNPLCAMRLPY